MKLLDTDIFIDLLRGLPEASKLFSEQGEEISFAAITEAELLSGRICDDQGERERLLHFLSQFEKIPIDNPLVQVAGDFRRTYGLEMPDALIAASAYVNGIILVTRNIKDFEKVKEIKVNSPY